MKQPISEERKTAYYVGMGLTAVGALLFISVFITGAMSFGNMSGDFASHARSEVFRAIAGMCLIAIGGITQGIAARGLAGSGVVLDPDKAREDLEPYSRMAGGMLKDALDEAKMDIGAKQVVMIKCQSCGKINDEDAAFCKACGKKCG